MLASCHAAHGVLFSSGLCLLVATNVMFMHSQNLNYDGSRIESCRSCAEDLHFSALIV